MAMIAGSISSLAYPAANQRIGFVETRSLSLDAPSPGWIQPRGSLH
jgi:hypothetical protein